MIDNNEIDIMRLRGIQLERIKEANEKLIMSRDISAGDIAWSLARNSVLKEEILNGEHDDKLPLNKKLMALYKEKTQIEGGESD